MPVGVEGDDSRGVPESRLYDLHRRSPGYQRTGVEVPQRVSVDVQRDRVDVRTNLGSGVLAYLGLDLAGTRPDRPPRPVRERLTRSEGEQWPIARVRRKVRRQLVNDHLAERHRPGALERLRWPDLTRRKPLPLDLHSAPQEVHIGDPQPERLTDPQAGPCEQDHERPVAR